jgi:hypothetical protein
MGNEVADARSFQDAVKEKIKKSFIDLIPENQWDELIKKSIDSFIVAKPSGYGSDGKSELERFVHEELRKKFSALINEKLHQYCDTYFSEEGHEKVSTMLEEIIVKNAGKIFSDMIGQSVKYAIQNGMQSGY